GCIMPFRFEEIAYQAELDRHESPEFEEEAYKLCGEVPETRVSKIQELRDMIYARGECQPPRMDDSFLLRFLRARRFVPARAHRLMVRYCQFREQNPYIWRDVDWYGMRRVGNLFEGVLYDRPDTGRLLLCRLVHQRGVHVVNCSRVFETLFYVFKRLAPRDDLWRRVYFHGSDMNSLHRYGGKRQPTSLYTWLTKVKQYKNKSFDDDISQLGYSCDYYE
ncbi:hypothetical protein MSG28_012489, partial [Choristoneura fumiferana]